MAGFLNLRAVLGLNSSGYMMGLKQAESAATAMATRVKGYFAAAFGVAAITAYATKVVNFADEVTDLSDRLDMSTKSLQEWIYTAQRSGASIEKVTSFFEHLASAKEKALRGDSNAERLFWGFGINLRELQAGMNVEDIAKRIGGKLRGGGAQELLPLLREIGGRGAGSLIPTLKAFDELSESANKFGQILGDDVLARVKALKSELQDIAGYALAPSGIALALKQVGVSKVHDFVKAGVLGGKSLAQGLWNGRGIHQSMLDAIESVGGVYSERKRKEAALANVGYKEAIGPQLPERILRVPAMARRTFDLTGNTDLTANQRVGALIRFDPSNSLRAIERNTGRMVDLLQEEKRNATVNVMRGNFGGAQAEQWEL